MKKIFALSFMLVTILSPINAVSAHVLITDQTKTKGAILHIIPDDDPVAGEESEFYFDMQSQMSESIDSVEFSIIDSEGNKNIVKTEISGTLVTAKYVFPTQGVYGLTFKVKANGETFIFSESQRVSRGVISGATDKQSYEWAEIMLIVSIVGFAVLGIIILNRRKEIAKQSTF